MRKLFIGFGTVLLLLLSCIRIIDPLPVEAVRLAYFDQLQKWQPRASDDFPVRVIDIDERSLSEQGQWPWPRDKLADMVTKLHELGAAAIVFDILFLEPDRVSPAHILRQPEYASSLEGLNSLDLPDHDVLFAQAMMGRGVVLGIAGTLTRNETPLPAKAGIVEIGNAPSLGFVQSVDFSPPLPILSTAAAGLGSINMSPYDTSERVRRVPLLWRNADGQVMPSLALEALRIALGEESFVIRGSSDFDAVTSSIRLGGFEIPTRADGSLWVHFRPDRPSLYRSAHDLLTADPEALRGDIAGHIVLIGTSAAGLLDIRTTALGENVPGVSIHAQIIEQILQRNFITRNDFVEGSELIAFIALGGMILWVMSVSGPLISAATAVLAGSFVVMASWFLFQQGLILFDATLPVLGGVVFFSAMTAFQFFVADREKKLIRRSFSHYVAPEVLQQIEKSGHRIELGGELRPISVMFCDIRNFTALSETMQATDMVSLLNNLFTVLSNEILRQKGTIDKFMGDSVMAFWNAPLDIENYPKKSCLAALSMRLALKRLNQTVIPTDQKQLEIAIGISMGTACVGNVGSKDRFDYSAIGDIVNRAARIEASCRQVGCDILVSEDVVQASTGLAFLHAGHLKMKGVSERQKIFALVGDAELAQSSGFQKLLEHHKYIVSLLEKGQEPEADLIEECLHLAREAELSLSNFYQSLLARKEDYRTHTVYSTAQMAMPGDIKG